ncbi:MAG: biotin/lipoyl-containing protein, partial [Clostridium sp.]
VAKGDTLLILEAMKMENESVSPRDAVVAGVSVNKGESVDSGTPLVSLQ